MEFGAVGVSGTIAQNVKTFAGGTYTLTYFLANDGGKPVQFFSSQFNGVTLSSLNGSAAGQPYTQYTFSGLLANGTSTPLVFSGQQDPAEWQLDDISLALNNLVNSSTVFLGPQPAVLLITNNFTQTSKGVLHVVVGGLGITQHDLIIAGGDAKLDGTLQVQRLNGFTFHHGDKVTILTTGGKVSGEFATYESNFGDNILSPIVVYGKDSVALEVSTYANFATTWGLPANELHVARALDSVVFDSRERSLINYLDNRSLSKLPGDFVRIAPTDITSIFAIGNSLATVQSLNIQRRAGDIRSGSSGFSAAGLAMNGAGPSYSGGFNITTGVAGPSGDDGKEVKETKQVVPAENRWGAFLSGTGEWVSVGNTDNARGYDLESGGFTLGVDYKVTPNLAIGLAAGYTGTTADLANNGRVWVNGGKIGLYGTFFQNEQVASAPMMSKDSSKDSSKEAPAPALSIAKGFYADVAVFGGYNSYDTRRDGLQGEARGSTEGGELNVLFGTGYDFKKGALAFGPHRQLQLHLPRNRCLYGGRLAGSAEHSRRGQHFAALGVRFSKPATTSRPEACSSSRSCARHGSMNTAIRRPRSIPTSPTAAAIPSS